MLSTERFDREIKISKSNNSITGKWRAEFAVSGGILEPDREIEVTIGLYLSEEMISALSTYSVKPESIAILITSERCFDPQGWNRFPLDEKMSTLLTPSGLAIEGGSSGAISRFTGSRFMNPIDEFILVPIDQLSHGYHDTDYHVDHKIDVAIPHDIPPGIYRLRIDFGFSDGEHAISFNNSEFANRPDKEEYHSLLYSPPLLCNGYDTRGDWIDATTINPRIYWVLLAQYRANGYQGVVADEDKTNFALSDRNIIPDEMILPLHNDRGNKMTYNLEPSFIGDSVDIQRNIPWNPHSGELTIRITEPEGEETQIGPLPFNGLKDGTVTTGNPFITEWQPGGYGQYTVTAYGWIEDEWGNRYDGGGTYRFWIAKRMTFGTSTFMGMPWVVGSRYGAEVGFAPAVPADVNVTVSLYPDSDPEKIQTISSGGRANNSGMFSSTHGMQSFVFTLPGEYHSHLLATYTDPDGHLWVCSLRHAGVIFPADTPITAHGKKLKLNGELALQGETGFEGYFDPASGRKYKAYLSYPYNYRDILLIASEGYAANEIEPVLTYEEDGAPYDPSVEELGASNVRIKTSNGLSPHLYPEFITEWAYYYVAASRPGLCARFMVGEDGIYLPAWPTSATDFGGQIGASNNGNTAGTPHRLLGGIVIRKETGEAQYCGYIATAYTLPKGSNNNRVISPGEEELLGANGKKYPYFIISHRPGLVYEKGYMFWPNLQLDPLVAAEIKYTMEYPDGRTKLITGTVDERVGYFLAPERIPLDMTGVYRFYFEADWKGRSGCVPGLPNEGAYLFVYDKEKPATAPKLQLALKRQQSFTIDEGITVEGFSTAEDIYYTVITPGAVIDQGRIPVRDGRFRYHFDPAEANRRVPIYDIENVITGRKETGRIVQFTLFAAEHDVDGSIWHSFTRIVMRGQQVHNIYTY